MKSKEYIKDKKVLVMGLGILGGGVATTKWLIRNGAKVIVTDLKSTEELLTSINKFTEKEKTHITFILGRHRKNDFKSSDIIVMNPGVPKESPYLTIASEHNIPIHNDTSLFFTFSSHPIISVTGTRGKTTSTNWIASLLSTEQHTVSASGNTPQNALLKEISKVKKDIDQPSVTELSSWQLERLKVAKKAPHIAAITNLYPDHLNRYKNIEEYARAKANIFKFQNEEDFLILNHDNKWTKFFLTLKPKSQIYYFSLKELPKTKNGIFVHDNKLIMQQSGQTKTIVDIKDFQEKWGVHNVENLCVTILTVLLYNPTIKITKSKLSNIHGVYQRQEVIHQSKNINIVNDNTSTSPDALLSAILRFKEDELIIICGGTDKKLDYKEVAKTIQKYINTSNCIFLEGSGTKKLLKELKEIKYFKNTQPTVFPKLDLCIKKTFELVDKNKKTTILFSPGGSSFEKYKNEFDRGHHFNTLIKKILKKRKG